MRRAFSEMYRVLKPGRWLTVAFHNSDNRIWNAIQQALQEARFQVADVRLLDKRQMSFKQASADTVRHDLVISAIADHLRRGASVPLDSQQFREGIRSRFEERDGMYFLPDQASQYDLLAASRGRKI